MSKVKSIGMLRTRLDTLLESAVDKIEKVMNDPRSKNTEIINSADKLIKLRFQIHDFTISQTLDHLRIQREQLSLEKQQIEMTALRLASGTDGKQDTGNKQHSRSFTPSIRPNGVNDNIIRTG